jgi:hypothetical protein
MSKAIMFLVISIVAVSLTCAKKVATPAGDKLLWASDKPRPDWAYKEPYAGEGMQYFVGMSHKYADEKSARDDGERESRLRAVRYLETAAKETFERITSELGLAGEVFNPSNATRGYAEWISQAVIQNAKIVQTYAEQWESANNRERYYLAFCKLVLPDQQVMESFNNYSNRKKDEWKMTQEQFDKVNESFKNYWESKKKESELKEGEKEGKE